MSEILRLITEYRAGLEAEISLLKHLTALALRERDVARDGRHETLDEISDARDQVMAALVSLEAQLKPLRQALRQPLRDAAREAEYRDLVALHAEAAALAEEVLTTDAESLTALRDAELARRFAAEALEKGESTLAAYRRVVMPSLASATLVNRRG